MTTASRDRLRAIKSLPSLVKYLRDDLQWEFETENVDDLFFEYTPDELGIDERNGAKIQEIKRLRPLSVNQPWGIFYVKFEPKRLPVVALRRFLSAVVPKKRDSANSSQRAAWASDDLLFISNYGEGEERQISFAHFSPAHDGQTQPTLKVLGWDNRDTALHLDSVANELADHLTWPENDDDTEAWREQWRAAFTLRHREVITTSKELSIRLAELARSIRDRAKSALAIETPQGPLTKLMKAFQQSLVRDLNADSFADMYAQTIAYGLLSARIADPTKKTSDDFAAHLRTNPFLRDLMETFLRVGGQGSEAVIDFDELGISEVVELLDDPNTHMEAVIRDFGDKNRDEDPVMHFFEGFLQAYDKTIKKERGVFYTPQPVVSYIVRSVHELLQTEFDLADGLADTTTWGEMLEKHPGLELPQSDESDDKRTISPDEPFVQILDPATGTGTFLVEVIDVVNRTVTEKWKTQGLNEAQQLTAWNDYVPKHLLPRLHAYELMMAPYAIAHMRVGLKLSETGYQFGDEERARIYLTNALEPWVKQLPLSSLDALAREAVAVNEIKRLKRFTIIIGNPPYSSSISEPPWLMTRLDDWKEGLNETKSDLNREEWKFLRLAQHHCSTAGAGIVGLIINRDFLDGIVKRKMREHLADTFPLRIAIDLNGDVKGNITDGNVFDIAQGVAIAMLSTHTAVPKLRFTSRVGTQEQKYADLIAKDPIDATLVESEPTPPYFRWVPHTSEDTAAVEAEYMEWPDIKSAFGVASSGIQTKRDALCVAFTRAEMWERIQRFQSLPDDTARDTFNLAKDGRDWTVTAAQADISEDGPNQRYLSQILYRPFDVRYTYWTGKTRGFLAYPRRDVMQHVIGHKNIGMIFNRQIAGDSVSHFGVSRNPICHGTFYLGNKGQDYFAPLSVFDEGLFADGEMGRSNFTPVFMNAVRNSFGNQSTNLTPENIFSYAYAVFNSPSYRRRYAEFLKIDFPHLPLTGNPTLFRSLAQLGSELTALHLLESSKLANPKNDFVGYRDHEVEKVSWSENTVWLDKAQSTGFQDVPEEVWNFHMGGYQVCEKWLKDRGPKKGHLGRKLSDDDIAHYNKIVTAITETILVLKEIDEVIERHGGWPTAFQPVSVEANLAKT